MSSFASDVKNEISHKIYEKKCCRRAELVALLRLGGRVYMEESKGFGLIFSSNNGAVARKTLALIRSENPKAPVKIALTKSKKLKKRSSFIVKIPPSEETTGFLQNIGFALEDGFIMEKENQAVKKACCQSAYIRGAFLAAGSLNRPEAEYHLEFSLVSRAFAKFLQELMKKRGFYPKLTDRKEEYVVYLKEGDAVADFLWMIEANASAEKFESARNIKEIRGQVNRIVNCETANLQRSVDAAGRQIDAIRALKKSGAFENLKKDLQETAAKRLENPEATAAELADMLFISKPAFMHRMKKILILSETPPSLS
ncbi:MAG: DNA-binding protein WhiA [Selenomonadaceae bacterium]|nr:DNA-binding protein WhiA [Selenomonadaceae bacterium]